MNTKEEDGVSQCVEESCVFKLLKVLTIFIGAISMIFSVVTVALFYHDWQSDSKHLLTAFQRNDIPFTIGPVINFILAAVMIYGVCHCRKVLAVPWLTLQLTGMPLYIYLASAIPSLHAMLSLFMYLTLWMIVLIHTVCFPHNAATDTKNVV